MLTKDTIVTKEIEDLILDNMSKRVFILIKHLKQYADGITGQSSAVFIFMNKGEGFKTKKEAKEVFKNMNKNGEYKNRPVSGNSYAKLGDFYNVHFLTGAQLIEKMEYYSIYPTYFRNNEI